MSLVNPNISGRAYWRSLEEYADSEEFQELLHSPGTPIAPEALKVSRRRFVQVMAASMALAGLTLTGCRRWPEKYLAPYGNRPEGRSPGTSVYYASQFQRGGVACGVLVEAYDGRPIKVEGNPQHPYSQGATDAWTQAHVLDLYDPDRSAHVLRGRGGTPDQSDWQAFEQFVNEHFAPLRNGAAERVAVLAEPSQSPSRQRLKQRFAEVFQGAGWYEWEPLNRDNERAGTQQAFGQALRPVYHYEQAAVVAAFDGDPLFDHPAAVRHARDWAKTRKVVDQSYRMSRVYAAEPSFTLIGSVADHRLPVRSSEIPLLIQGLANELGVSGAATVSLNGSTDFIDKLAADLQANAGASIVTVGAGHGPEVHAMVWAINEHLENLGQTIELIEEPGDAGAGQLEQVRELTERINNGEIDTLVILGGNPAYNAPADLGFAEALEQVQTVVHHAMHYDETSLPADWHVPATHELEAWGDGRAWDGTVSLQQPLIQPLFNGRSELEVLALLTGDAGQGYDIVRQTFGEQFAADADSQAFEQAWRKALHDGVVEDSALTPVDVPSVDVAGIELTGDGAGDGAYELTFRTDPNVYDGRYANNGWLQELPGPLTKLTWDNAALVSVRDAREQGWEQGDRIQVTVGERELDLPVFPMPGQAAGTVVVTVGYGREAAGRIGNGVGRDTYRLRTSDRMYLAPATVERAGGRERLATTQNHHLIHPAGEWAVRQRVGEQIGQEPDADGSGYLIRDLTVDQYREHAEQQQRRPREIPLQLWNPPYGKEAAHEHAPVAFNYPHAWGMTIDMNACIGCNACVVACQAENNVPVVGKSEVLVSREMHWLRIDRYFKGDPEESPDVVHQPMMCVHCENAPCEQVCPVNATVHDTEGLNLQVYNRCIGTRYCSNNCPYKVRRFNFYDYHRKHPREVTVPPWQGFPDTELSRGAREADETLAMRVNPDVTVRMRGVMEKCTYCIQRIAQAKRDARQEWAKDQRSERRQRSLPGADRDEPYVQDGQVMTACQQVCPTQAIVFGNLNEQDAEVTQLQQVPRSYQMLNPELNTRPRTHFLAKLRNPAGSGEPPSSAE